MSTLQQAGLDGGPRISSLQRPGSPLRRLLAGVSWMWKGRHQRLSLDGLNDYMLADIGLRRDAGPLRGLRPPDPWLLAQHLR